ncbi:MAG: DUF3302 domain-containing protein [Colwellia sp.]|nr:DUF3302 domain-containing protein [Colwellia sp.]
MVLEYISLGILIFAVVTVFYGIIIIHDIPYDIARKRNHPQQDAIHVAGWISLLTLHLLWPFLWIWATLYREDRGWGFLDQKSKDTERLNSRFDQQQIALLTRRIELLEAKLTDNSYITSNTDKGSV